MGRVEKVNTLGRKEGQELDKGRGIQGMLQVWSQFHEGQEGEFPLLQARMGDDEVFLLHEAPAKEEDIYIEAPGTLGHFPGSIPAMPGLYAVDGLEEGPWLKLGEPTEHRVDKVRLIGHITRL